METEDFSEAVLRSSREIAQDKKYQYEIYPARMFKDHAKTYLGIDVSDLRENPNDPPDFTITANGIQINVEVTTLFEEIMQQRNSFFERVESLAKEIIEENFLYCHNL